MIGKGEIVLAAFLVLAAAAAGANLILTPVYHDGSPEYPVWSALNWVMAVAVVVTLLVNCLRRCLQKRESPGVAQYLSATLAFYGAIVLTMLFFWEWAWTLNPDSETGDAVTSHVIYFPIVDALFVVVCLATGRYLWSGPGGPDDGESS